MDLRSFDQRVDIYRLEAEALRAALTAYATRLAMLSATGSLSVQQALQLRPLQLVTKRVAQLLAGTWPTAQRGPRRRTTPRRLRLGFDELLLLNYLNTHGLMQAAGLEQQLPYDAIKGRINQASHNLSTHFIIR